ncbi:solute carrier family 22 member 7-like isoform X2 [Contarinia nasturtii]|uniref:solute carrier family 22 member 7-like isoform X2 n=1 Tax=Contarinia nasturtii TaxID=265458 RepID=UPI0012D3A618|nr:solute carrier family 22 member 7-like isoform X2 [Contarinia nasturtii]
MSVEDSVDSSLDTILTEVGVFGISEFYSYTLLFIANVVAASFVHNYIISANTLEYRCKVPECDVGGNNRDIEYDQPWLRFGIPTSDDGLLKDCVRYAPINKSLSGAFNGCSADMFDKSQEIECSEYIYASDERNVQTEFNIHCADTYKLALVGTANNAGRFLFMPLTGLLSDKFGRLRVIVIGMLCSSVFGIIKSFSINYIMYTALEFLESAAGTSTYTCSCVLGVEYVNSKHRVLGSSIVFMSYPMGAVLLGLVAMYVSDPPFKFSTYPDC